MGQSKQRKQRLGDLYGTKEGSNDHRRDLLSLRWMEPNQREDFRQVVGDILDSRCVFLIGTLRGIDFNIAARPCLDAAGQFNSHVWSFWPKEHPNGPLQGSRKRSDHRTINKFLLTTADLLIMD